MPSERYYIDQPLHEQKNILLKDSEFHHMSRVMRTHKGEQVELVNGKGILALAIVEDIYKDHAILNIVHIEKEEENDFSLILIQAIPKPNRLDFIIEKGTELGVKEFWLFPSENSVKKDFTPEQLHRLQTQIIASMKQCGRLFLPKCQILPPIPKWNLFPGTLFFGDVEKNAPLFSKVWRETPLTPPIFFVVGPESGLSQKEIALLKSKGAYGVKLHPNILRTDTAPLVALSLLSHWMLESTKS